MKDARFYQRDFAPTRQVRASERRHAFSMRSATAVVDSGEDVWTSLADATFRSSAEKIKITSFRVICAPIAKLKIG